MTEWQGEMKTHGLSLYENPLVTIYRKLNIEKLNFKQLHVVGYQKYTKVQGYLRNIWQKTGFELTLGNISTCYTKPWFRGQAQAKHQHQAPALPFSLFFLCGQETSFVSLYLQFHRTSVCHYVPAKGPGFKWSVFSLTRPLCKPRFEADVL